MKMNVVRLEPRDGRGGCDHEQRNLRAGPDIQPPVLELDHRVHRLQRRMREIGDPVFGLDHLGILQRAFDVALMLETAVLPCGDEGAGDRLEHISRSRRVRCRPPVELDGIGGLKRAPGIVGDHAGAAGDRHDLEHALRFLGDAGIVAVKAAADPRIGANRGVDHARHPDVDAEGRGARRLGDGVDAPHRLAEVAPLRFGLEFDIGRRLDRRRGLRQRSVAQRLAVGRDHRAVLGLQVGLGNSGLLGGSLQQYLARDRACDPQLLIGVGHRRRAAGDLQAEKFSQRVAHHAHAAGNGAVVGGGDRKAFGQHLGIVIGGARRTRIDPDVVPVEIEFLGDQGGLHRIGALAEIGARRDDGDAALVDPHIGRQRGFAGAEFAGQRIGRGSLVGVVAEGHASCDRRRADQECATRNGSETAHGLAFLKFAAAVFTASRIRG